MRERKLLYFALGVLAIVGPGQMALRNDAIQFPDGSVQRTAAGGSPTVYLTSSPMQANGATAACAAGFHMASIWEIPDARNLDYDKTVSGAHTFGDLGEGPPAGFRGWIRTGFATTENDLATGSPNCSSWTSTTGKGTVAWLNEEWLVATSMDFLPGWRAETRDCSSSFPVWCVKD